MPISKDAKVQDFINQTMLLDEGKHQILEAMRTIVFKQYPNTAERMMYGGILFSINEEDWGGIFVYKNHLSFEFGLGFKLEDPEKLLEGKGKFRRHLKIRSLEEVGEKKLIFYIKQIESLES